MNYLYHVVILTALYGLVAMSLEILVGRLGLASLCHAGFFGVGAYAATLLQLHLQWNTLSALLGAAVIAGVASAAVSIPSIRLSGDYFAIATFGVQAVLWQLFNNLTHVTGGTGGIARIPPPSIFGWTPNSPASHCAFILAMVAFVSLIATLGLRGQFGRLLLSVRDSETLVMSIGRNPLAVKVQASALSAACAAIGGGLYAGYATYIDPGNFYVSESILFLAMVVVGGVGRWAGPFIGAATLVLLPEGLRFVGMPSAMAASARHFLYGIALLLLVMYHPNGLAGRYGSRSLESSGDGVKT